MRWNNLQNQHKCLKEMSGWYIMFNFRNNFLSFFLLWLKRINVTHGWAAGRRQVHIRSCGSAARRKWPRCWIHPCRRRAPSPGRRADNTAPGPGGGGKDRRGIRHQGYEKQFKCPLSSKVEGLTCSGQIEGKLLKLNTCVVERGIHKVQLRIS